MKYSIITVEDLSEMFVNDQITLYADKSYHKKGNYLFFIYTAGDCKITETR